MIRALFLIFFAVPLALAQSLAILPPTLVDGEVVVNGSTNNFNPETQAIRIEVSVSNLFDAPGIVLRQEYPSLPAVLGILPQNVYWARAHIVADGSILATSEAVQFSNVVQEDPEPEPEPQPEPEPAPGAGDNEGQIYVVPHVAQAPWETIVTLTARPADEQTPVDVLVRYMRPTQLGDAQQVSIPLELWPGQSRTVNLASENLELVPVWFESTAPLTMAVRYISQDGVTGTLQIPPFKRQPRQGLTSLPHGEGYLAAFGVANLSTEGQTVRYTVELTTIDGAPLQSQERSVFVSAGGEVIVTTDEFAGFWLDNEDLVLVNIVANDVEDCVVFGASFFQTEQTWIPTYTMAAELFD